jgi:hypothetical protein
VSRKSTTNDSGMLSLASRRFWAWAFAELRIKCSTL